jgi:maleate isomerase
MESEFRIMLPQNVTIHTARLRLQRVTVEDLSKMEKYVEEEAVKLADADADVIAYGCTSGSLFKGLGHAKMLEERIEKASGKPAVATATAVVNSLEALGIETLAVATPYVAEINDLEGRFLVANGFKVVDLKGLHLSDNIEIGKVSGETVCELVTKLENKEADGIFISCTNFPTISILNKLEEKLGKAVISSNTATLWAMLKRCNARLKIEGYGKLLKV